jgi:thymidylate synthase
MHELTVTDIRSIFINELANERFTIDKTGAKTIEMIGASFIATEPSIFGTVNEEYVRKEIDWYMSGSTNINDIYGDEREPPQAWKYSANRHGEINSNYGHLIFDDKYFRQYEQALIELTENPDSRRACMIYNRPSIQVEFQENSKNDFICTNAVTYYIRNGELQAVVQMRSNDVVFGYKNDYAWQQYVLKTLASDLGIEPGAIQWQVQNLHVYERHFNLVK